MSRVSFLPEAADDLEDALRYLERRGVWLSAAFRAEVERAVDLLRRHPHAGPEVAPGVHRLVIHRFSYALLYRVSEDTIFVTHLRHQRREPTSQAAQP